jgi:hypothetical protein
MGPVAGLHFPPSPRLEGLRCCASSTIENAARRSDSPWNKNAFDPFLVWTARHSHSRIHSQYSPAPTTGKMDASAAAINCTHLTLGQAEADLLNVTITRYTTVAAVVLVVYDSLLTIGDEVR